jgi:hypothetical protein
MGYGSPQHLDLVQQNHTKPRTTKTRTVQETNNHPKTYAEGFCKPATIASQKAKPSMLYELSKTDIAATGRDIRHAIFRYKLS